MASCFFSFFCFVCFYFRERRVRKFTARILPGSGVAMGHNPTVDDGGRTPARRKLILPRDVFRRMVRIPSPLALPARRSRRECTFKSGSNPAERPGTRNGQRFQYRCDGSPGNSGCQASSLRSSRVTGAFTRLLLLSSNNEIGHAAVRASYLPAN